MRNLRVGSRDTADSVSGPHRQGRGFLILVILKSKGKGTKLDRRRGDVLEPLGGCRMKVDVRLAYMDSPWKTH